MDVKFNVAAILKYKPKGTKLYDYLHNIDVEFNDVETTEIETSIWCTREKGGYNELFGYSKLGTLRGWLDGLQILLPSKEMRDWSKFAWKKGDVLVSKDNVHIIFEKFEDDAYTRFKGKHYLWKECNVEDYNKEETKMLTSVFEKATDDVAQTYIKTIEEHLDGKLNLETLEIEKQLEFKDGDIVVYGKSVAICRKIYKHTLSFYVSLNEMVGLLFADEVESSEEYRFATEEEKQQLFDALEKEGKAWDAKKKAIVDLKPKYEFKPMDLCLMKYIGQYNNRGWELCQYAYTEHRVSSIGEQRDFYHAVGGEIYAECIPYKGNEHLLGTTNNVED